MLFEPENNEAQVTQSPHRSTKRRPLYTGRLSPNTAMKASLNRDGKIIC